jgi:uncharacterized membrane protein YoaK (UPF0700 family)
MKGTRHSFCFPSRDGAETAGGSLSRCAHSGILFYNKFLTAIKCRSSLWAYRLILWRQYRGSRKVEHKSNDFFLECEKHWVFWMMILVGGFYGGYTFSVRGGVFCNAQTANVVLFSMAIGNGQWKKALYLLIPISAYLFGAIISEILAKKVKHFHILRWDTILVGFEIFICFFLGALPKSAPDQICQVTLNFICSMQFNTFRQNEGIPMATTFVTNHIRQTGSCLVKAIRDKDPKASLRWKMHASMIVFFAAGVIIATLFCRLLDVRAIWAAMPILLYIFIRLAHADRTYEKPLLERTPHGH